MSRAAPRAVAPPSSASAFGARATRVSRPAGVLVVLVGWLAALAGPAAASELYARHCAACHGPGGRGDAPVAGMLAPRPTDFTSGVYKFRSTPAGTLPTVEDVARTIARGLPGTSMPAFAGRLSPDEITALARFVLSLAPADSRRAAPVSLGPAPPRTAEAMARGAELYARLRCAACHGIDGRSEQWLPALESPAVLPPTDLTAPWAFRGGGEPAAIALRILTGIDGSIMPSFAGVLSPRDAWDIAYYVASLARRPAWEESNPEAIRRVGVSDNALARGRYLTHAMLCALCHTPVDPTTGAYLMDYFMAGGTRITSYPWGVWYSRNLTPDLETGLGEWTEEQIVTALTRGIARDGRRLDPLVMPWPWFAALTPEDARAIATYLKRLPAVRNAIPKPQHVPVLEAVGGKLLALAGATTSLEFWGGNAADELSLRGLPEVSARRQAAGIAVGLAAVVLGLACVASAWRLRRRPWLAVLALAIGGAILAFWSLLAVWPPLRLLDPGRTVRWMFAGAPSVPADLDPAARALAQRGQYVAAVAACGLCHTPTSPFVGVSTARTLAGGATLRWRVYGAAVAPNLTPDPRRGAGRADEAALERAIASGMASDGRQMHWQAMPWDMFSRWSMEDRRALIAYLRVLPPVPGQAPPPRGPRPGDPVADTLDMGDAIDRR